MKTFDEWMDEIAYGGKPRWKFFFAGEMKDMRVTWLACTKKHEAEMYRARIGRYQTS